MRAEVAAGALWWSLIPGLAWRGLAVYLPAEDSILHAVAHALSRIACTALYICAVINKLLKKCSKYLAASFPEPRIKQGCPCPHVLAAGSDELLQVLLTESPQTYLIFKDFPSGSDFDSAQALLEHLTESESS